MISAGLGLALLLLHALPAAAQTGLIHSGRALSRGGAGLQRALSACRTPLSADMAAVEKLLALPVHPDVAPEAFSILAPDPSVPLVMTVEHARNAVPPGTVISPSDAPWLPKHWGWDPGAELLTRALLRELGGSAVFCGYSRLLCDPNRPPGHPTQMPTELEGETVELNARLTPEEIERRLRTLYVPFHRAVDDHIAARAATPGHEAGFLLSVHSFTRLYDGDVRTLEVGILHDAEHTEVAAAWLAALRNNGFPTAAAQEPYTGLVEGNVFSPLFHGRKNGLPVLELEVRNDLIDTPEKAAAVAKQIAASLREFWPEGLGP